MACLASVSQGQTLTQRMSQVEKALSRLEQYLTQGRVRLVIGVNGALAFQGWADRDGISDVCAARSMSATSSWAFRQAVLKAEAMSGRKVNMKAVAAGMHSHDGGHTFGKH